MVAHDVVPVGDDVGDVRFFAWRCDPLSGPVFVELLLRGARLIVDDGLAENAVRADAYVIFAANIFYMVHVAYEVGAAWAAVRHEKRHPVDADDAALVGASFHLGVPYVAGIVVQRAAPGVADDRRAGRRGDALRDRALSTVAEIHQHFFLLDPSDGRMPELGQAGIARLQRAVAAEVAQIVGELNATDPQPLQQGEPIEIGAYEAGVLRAIKNGRLALALGAADVCGRVYLDENLRIVADHPVDLGDGHDGLVPNIRSVADGVYRDVRHGETRGLEICDRARIDWGRFRRAAGVVKRAEAVDDDGATIILIIKAGHRRAGPHYCGVGSQC